MKWSQLNLQSKIYSVDDQNLVLKEKQIYGIILTPKFNGRTEEMILEKSILTIETSRDVLWFELTKSGEIKEDHPSWIVDHNLAKEELIVAKSKERDANNIQH